MGILDWGKFLGSFTYFCGSVIIIGCLLTAFVLVFKEGKFIEIKV